MYDIHCHVLSKTDDGAIDIEDSLSMCKAAAEEGVEAIIATPHFIVGETEPQGAKMLSQIYLLNRELRGENINLRVLPGMEVMIKPSLSELYEEEKIIALNYRKYILVELPYFGNLPLYLYEELFNLQLKGLQIVIAHAERYEAIIKNPGQLYDLIDRGCLIQVNSGSIQGQFGRKIKNTAFTLLKHKMVHVIASDNHSTYGRMSSLKEAFDIITKKYGSEAAEDLFINNPYSIIKGRDVHADDPIKPLKRKWFGWFG